jgi:hypothetical protein
MPIYRGEGGSGDSSSDAYASQIQQYATDAANSAKDADASAKEAAGHASNAAASAQQSAQSATESAGHAQDSANSATESAGHAQNSANSATESEGHATNSEGFAQNSANSATESAGHASQAGEYKDDAKKIADYPEDSQYTLSDGTTGYSAYHWSQKAQDNSTPNLTGYAKYSDDPAPFSGLVSARAFVNTAGGGILPGGNNASPSLLPTDNTGGIDSDAASNMSLGSGTYKWKDGHFSGTVNAASFVGDGSQLTGIEIPDVEQIWTDNGDGSISYFGNTFWDNNRLLVPYILGVGDGFNGNAPSGGIFVCKSKSGNNKMVMETEASGVGNEACLLLKVGSVDWRLTNSGETGQLRFSADSSSWDSTRWPQMTLEKGASSEGILRVFNSTGKTEIGNSTNWSSAYNWGNHASAGYATQTWVNNKGYSTYTGSDAVKTSGNQTVGGIKTFSSELRCSADIVAYYSDERLKDVQGPIENPLDKVDAIETFYYTHNDIAKSMGYSGDEVQVGVSAQSVQAVMPECVKAAPIDLDEDGNSISGENYLTVQYERLVPLLLESIKELTARVKELENGGS